MSISIGETLARTANGQCPNCGRGPLFAGFLQLNAACPVCGEDFTKADTGDGPAFFVMFVVAALVVPFAFVMQTLFGWGPLLLLAAASALTIGLSLALLRPAKGMLFGMQWRHKAEEGRLEEP